MPTADASVKSEGNKLVVTFELEDGPHYLTVNVRPVTSFECSKATLVYGAVEQLLGPCVWSGTAKKTSLHMKLGDGVTITGQLDVPRLSTTAVSGTGAWTAGSGQSLNQPNAQSAAGNGEPELTIVPDPIAKLARETQLLESGAPIIAIFGQSGVGKSTFINLITSEKQNVGKGLQSCTSEIHIIEATVGGKPVVVIDTPGIDDTRSGVSEADVLVKIANRLETMGRNKIWVTGVLFLHRISDNKFSQTAGRVSEMLKKLCGDDAMKQLTLCTTMWDLVTADVALERLSELCDTGAWKEMAEKGANTVQIANLSPDAKEKAEKIVVDLIENKTVMLRIQKQMIDEGKSVLESDAGKVLEEHLREIREETEHKLKEEREIRRKEMEASAAEAQKAMEAQRLEVERLKKQAEEHRREQQALAEHLKREKEKAERERRELEERIRSERAAEAAKLEAARRARDREAEELKRRMDALAQQQIIHVLNIPVHIVNKRFRTVVDWNGNGNHCEGHVLHGGKNQQYVLERAGEGYVIAVKAHGRQSRYLGLSQRQSESRLIAVDNNRRVIWNVQSGDGTTFRITPMDRPMQCLELSAAAAYSPILLTSHATNATHQLWEFAMADASRSAFR